MLGLGHLFTYVEDSFYLWIWGSQCSRVWKTHLQDDLKNTLFSSGREWPSARLCLCLNPIMSYSLAIGPLNCLFCSQRGAWTRDWIGPLYGLRRGVASTRLLTLLACTCSERSEHFMHEKRGYVQVAHFPKIGYKFNKWHDIIWMQKTIDGPVRGKYSRNHANSKLTANYSCLFHRLNDTNKITEGPESCNGLPYTKGAYMTQEQSARLPPQKPSRWGKILLTERFPSSCSSYWNWPFLFFSYLSLQEHFPSIILWEHLLSVFTFFYLLNRSMDSRSKLSGWLSCPLSNFLGRLCFTFHWLIWVSTLEERARMLQCRIRPFKHQSRELLIIYPKVIANYRN